MRPNFETDGSRDRLAKRWWCHSKYPTHHSNVLLLWHTAGSVFNAFLKPVMYDVVTFMLMLCYKNYSHWATFARDIAINLVGLVFLTHGVVSLCMCKISRNTQLTVVQVLPVCLLLPKCSLSHHLLLRLLNSWTSPKLLSQLRLLKGIVVQTIGLKALKYHGQSVVPVSLNLSTVRPYHQQGTFEN